MGACQPAPVTRDRPPILRDLLSFERYKTYFKTIPIMPKREMLNPWQVWVHKVDNSGWVSRCVSTYREAYTFIQRYYNETDNFDDFCIVSRSVLFNEPWEYERHPQTNKIIDERPLFKGMWDRNRYEWCKRCRRPSLFENWHPLSHHALKKLNVLTIDEPYRCYYCGARRFLAGDHYHG